MDHFLKSASKIAFLMLVLTCCAGFLLNKLDAKDFMVVVMAACGFFFAYKGDPNLPFAGK